MSRGILIYGQSGVGKSYSMKNLDPKTTLIIDADKKNSLPWRGFKKNYFSDGDNKNFVSVSSLEAIRKTIEIVGSAEKFSHIKTLVIDGISKALLTFEALYVKKYKPTNKFEPFAMLKEKAVDVFNTAKEQRENLTVVFIGNVEIGDFTNPSDVDKLKVAGGYLRKNYEVESDFNYVFYAKKEDGIYFFETQANKSTAKTPEGCFPEKIPNDIAAAIENIIRYEEGEE